MRFFEEYESSAKVRSEGNVIAVLDEIKDVPLGREYKCLWSNRNIPNGPVDNDKVSIEFLNVFCIEVTEERAREIHPKLFERIETDQRKAEKIQRLSGLKN